MAVVPASNHGVDTSQANTWTANQTAPAWIASGLTGATAASRYVGATASGAPASGTFAVGDFIVDETGKFFVCTTQGSPGTWTQVGGASGAMTQLSATVLGADGVFDVSGLSGAYNSLLLVLIVRGTRAATGDSLQFRLNNDSSGNYDSTENDWFTGTPTNTSTTTQTSATILQNMPAASATSGLFTMAQAWIPGYASTTWQKLVVVTGAYPGGGGLFMSYTVLRWRSTAAVTRVGAFGGTTANLLAGSALYIYGVN